MPDDRVYYTLNDYGEELDTMLAGRAAESLRYTEDEVSGGAASDLRSASALALHMVTELGFAGPGKLLCSDKASPAATEAAEKLLAASYQRTVAKLRANQDRLMRLAQELQKRQELSGEHVRKILALA